MSEETQKSLAETTVKSETIYEGKIIGVRIETVELPNMKYSKREIVDHQRGVGMVAVTPQGTMFMVEQFRIAVKQSLLEIPAGLVDPGENPQEAAVRELQEEIGYKPGKLEYLLDAYSSPGFTNERLSLFLASDLEKSKLEEDETEFLKVKEVPIKELYQKVLNLEIVDAKTIIGIQYAYQHWKAGDLV